MRALRVSLLALAGVSVLLFAAALLLPLPLPAGETWALFRSELVVSELYVILHVAAGIFFLVSVAGFKPELRVAYKRLAVGIMLVGVALLELPLVNFLDLWEKWPLNFGVIAIPYGGAMLAILWALGPFYRALQIRSRWHSPRFVALLTAGLLVVVLVAPRASNASPWLSKPAFLIGVTLRSLSMFVTFLAAMNVLVVRRNVGLSYAKIFWWLAVGIFVEVGVQAGGLIGNYVGLDVRPVYTYLQDGILVAAVPFLVAGNYSYRLLAGVVPAGKRSDATAVDAVLFAASLAAEPASLDPILDGLRSITANIEPGEPGAPLSEADQAALADVYLRIEDWLVSREPLRRFTVPQLRALVHSKFANAAISPRFWDKLA